MAVINNVEPSTTIESAWGNSVANELNNLALKADGSRAMTGTNQLTLSATNPTAANHATRKAYVDAGDATLAADKLNKSGGTMTGTLDMDGEFIINVPTPTAGHHAARMDWVQGQDGLRVATAGDTMTGVLTINTATDKCIELQGANAYIEIFNEAGTTRRALIQGQATPLNGLYLKGEPNAALNADTLLLLCKTSASVAAAGVEIAGDDATSHGRTAITIDDTAANANLLLRHEGTTDASGQAFIRFERAGGTLAGRLEQGAGNTVDLLDGSDYRLKNILGPVTDALGRLVALQPKRFTYKDDPACTEFEGFVAHELADVVPRAVKGVKDAVDADGNIAPQGVDTRRLVPMLVAAVQELAVQVAELKAAAGYG